MKQVIALWKKQKQKKFKVACIHEMFYFIRVFAPEFM